MTNRDSMVKPQKHSEYKASKATWIEKVPAHWGTRQIRTIAKVTNGATPSTTILEYWDGTINWITPDDLGKLNSRYISETKRRITQEGYESCGTTLAPAGSIVLSTRAPIGHLALLANSSCSNQGCKILMPKEHILPEFLLYELEAARGTLQSLGQGTTFAELSYETLSQFQVALPPREEQAAIVRFLDRGDEQIQRYIASKERLIALLEEERQALVHQAVTRGLDPSVPFRPSGVEWMGDVPEHWEVRTLGQCRSVSGGALRSWSFLGRLSSMGDPKGHEKRLSAIRDESHRRGDP